MGICGATWRRRDSTGAVRVFVEGADGIKRGREYPFSLLSCVVVCEFVLNFQDVFI